jgi:hypothetical protein
MYLYVDGVTVASSTATFKTSSGGFPVGFGIGPQSSSGFEGASKVARNLYRLSGIDIASDRMAIEWILATQYGVTLAPLIASLGDSIMYGTGATTPSTGNPIACASKYLGGWGYYADGHPGYKSSDLLTLVGSGIFAQGGGCRPKRIALLFAGTNDNAQGVSLSTWQTNMTALYNALVSAGYVVFVATLFPWVNGSPFAWDASKASQQNAWIVSTFPRVVDLASTPELQLVGGAYDGIYRWSNNSTGALGHLKDPGDRAAGRVIAGTIAGYLRSQ